MNKIKVALAFFAGLVMFACSEKDEALLYDNYDFISIKGDSVISRDGLEMVASYIDVTQDTFLKITYSELNSQVTVGDNVFKLNLFIPGAKSGKYDLKLGADEPLDYLGYVDYTMLTKNDTLFKTDTYAILQSNINWEDVDNKTVLLNVNCKGRKMINDSTLGKPTIVFDGKIRAIKQ